ncbi:hypothetical protein JTB14_010220 [Gonioctena quinquepunctata]|nr:hypothetical protein JTB14_010220 [Gonioctena quinquepunctata]
MKVNEVTGTIHHPNNSVYIDCPFALHLDFVVRSKTNMKIFLVLLAVLCVLGVTFGRKLDEFDADTHSIESEHGPETPEHIRKLFLKRAEKTTVEKQKKVLSLVYHVNQESHVPEHIKIAKNFSPFNAHDSPLYLKDDVVEKFHKFWKYAPLAKRAIFSIFDDDHMHQAIALFRVLYYAEDFDVFYKTAVWARMNVNEGMFVYCLYVTVVHRADTKDIMLPPIHEVTPHMFFGADVINEAQYHKQVHGAQEHEKSEGYDGYTIDSNYANHHMNLDYEQASLAHFIEDVGMNSLLYYVHIRYPFWMNSTEFGWSTTPRGYLHHLVHLFFLGRYNLERIPINHDDIGYVDWDLPVDTPYHSNLVYPDGMPFPNRPKFANLQEHFYNYGQDEWDGSVSGHTLVKNFERRLDDSLEAVWSEDETKMTKIDYDRFLNTLGNVIECNHDSPNRQFHGPIWHYARHLLGYSTQQLNKSELVPSALEHFETTVRDPVFYQLIKKLVVNPFVRYTSKWPSYTKDELLFKGVEVTEVEVDPLVTFYDRFNSSLINSVFYNPSDFNKDFKIRVSQYRLNHAPFEYRIHVKSDKQQKASVKIFIGPKYDRDGRPIHITKNRIRFVALDHFVTDLHVGDNVVKRKYSDNLMYVPDRMSYDDLWYGTVAALTGEKEFTTDLRQNWCGVPRRFMIPKGSVGGFPYQLFIAVYQFTEPHDYTIDPIPVDNYALNHPLDRSIKYGSMWDHIPNFHFKDVKVYFRDED